MVVDVHHNTACRLPLVAVSWQPDPNSSPPGWYTVTVCDWTNRCSPSRSPLYSPNSRKQRTLLHLPFSNAHANELPSRNTRIRNLQGLHKCVLLGGIIKLLEASFARYITPLLRGGGERGPAGAKRGHLGSGETNGPN